MNMQVRINSRDFEAIVSEKGKAKLKRIDDEKRIVISDLAMASRQIVADYPHLCAWHCVRVAARHEFHVQKALDEQDVEALVPTRKGDKKYTRGRVIEAPVLPVMPGYVLVHIRSHAQAFIAIGRVKHVIEFVGAAERPYRIKDHVIEMFKQRADGGAYDHRVVTVTYCKGEPVRVIDGPFASFSGVVLESDESKTRIRVEVDIFGRATPVELDVAQIEKV